MKNLILYSIQIYWKLKTKNKIGNCIFRQSCSNYVYEISKSKGFIEGLKAFRFRFSNCKHGFELFKNPVNNEIEMLLCSNIIVKNNEIAERLLETK